MMASKVLIIHTNRNGLAGPNQLTKEKLNIRINTPVISTAAICFSMNKLNSLIMLLRQ
jgi:hypothetical protein